MIKFCDVHGHYAWGIDDGIKTEKEAKSALKKARSQGIHTIVATPHLNCGHSTLEDVMRVRQRINELKVLAKKYKIKVYEGCELMLNRYTLDQLDSKLFIPFENTKYLLCEYDLKKTTETFMNRYDLYLNQIIALGYTPIVAHIERYFNDDIDLEYVKYLIDLGCVIQINSTSILNKKSSIHHRNAITLLDHQLVHLIASDTHQANGRRVPNLKNTYYQLYKMGYSQRYLKTIFNLNQRRILRNSKIIKSSYKKRNIITSLLHHISYFYIRLTDH